MTRHLDIICMKRNVEIIFFEYRANVSRESVTYDVKLYLIVNAELMEIRKTASERLRSKKRLCNLGIRTVNGVTGEANTISSCEATLIKFFPNSKGARLTELREEYIPHVILRHGRVEIAVDFVHAK
jgi:hypothetical protein